MTTKTTPGSTQREPELLGQTVVVIGGSAGIGLETARRARAEGAEVILTGRDPERLQRAALDVGRPQHRRLRRHRSGRAEAILRRSAGPDRPRDGHRPAARTTGRPARDGLRSGAPSAQRPRHPCARGRPQRRRQDAAGRHADAHGRHRRPADQSRPRDRLRGHRRAASVHSGPRARARAGPRQPHRRRLRRHPAVGVASRQR